MLERSHIDPSHRRRSRPAVPRSASLVLVVGVPVALLAWVGSPLPGGRAVGLRRHRRPARHLHPRRVPREGAGARVLAGVDRAHGLAARRGGRLRAGPQGRCGAAGRRPPAGRRPARRRRWRCSARSLATQGPAHLRADASPLAPPAQPVVRVRGRRRQGRRRRRPRLAATPAAAPVALPVYEVQRRDTLWDIAETHLGDPFRWPEIFQHQPGLPAGRRRVPDRSRPHLPGVAAPAARPTPSALTPAAPPPAAEAPAPAPAPAPAAPHESVAHRGRHGAHRRRRRGPSTR